MQSLSLGVSICVRWAQDIVSPQLEILTLVFAICAFITSIIRWAKPKDVRAGTIIPETEECEDFNFLPKPVTFREIFLPNGLIKDGIFSRFKDDTIGPNRSLGFVLMMSCIMIPIGGLHLIAWKYHFPTPAERIVWITASLASCGIPTLIIVFVYAILPVDVWISLGKRMQLNGL